jgi:ABC-type multidrug transport system fused ATPase/permease subunit
MLAALGLTVANMVLGWPVWGVVALTIAAASFVALVVAHAFVLSDKALIEDRAAWIRAGQARMAGSPDERAPSKKNPDPFGKRFEKADHENASDLDLFGEHSLFRTLSRAETSVGEETLASYLLRAAPAADVLRRQEAAKELLLTPVFLEDLAVFARRAESRGRAEEPLAVWGEAPAELPLSGVNNGAPASRAKLILAARLLVPLTIGLFLAKGSLAAVAPLLRHAYLVSFVAQLAVLGGLYRGIDRMVTFVSSRESPLGRFRKVFELIEAQQQLESPLLRRVVETLTTGAQDGSLPASREIASLERIVGFADLRHNAIVHMVVNAVFLYDVWVALALERWRHRAGRRTRKWLVALGECEALASIATYAGENPEFAWPVVGDDPPGLTAEGLGHPLIAREKRVVNDASLSQAGERALLITGSNMSGKSTYLRSIGLCAVMAGAGLPVCAKRAVVSTMKTWTSMRIGDALDRGMSHFYAELVRLKAIVASAQAGDGVLFLLDEILHGTNSHERSIGARGVVLDLVQRGAVGAVSTHDFALVAIADESSGRVRKVHFSDRMEGGKMVFDYRLKPGVVESTNAIRLMKHLGIDVEYQLPSSEVVTGSEERPS